MNWKRNFLRAAGLTAVVSGLVFLGVDTKHERYPVADLGGTTPQAEASTGAPTPGELHRGDPLGAVVLRLEQLSTELSGLKGSTAVASSSAGELERVLAGIDELRHQQQALTAELAAVESSLESLARPSPLAEQLAGLQHSLDSLDSMTGELSGKVEHLQSLATFVLEVSIPERADDALRQSRVASLEREILVAEAELQRRVDVAETQQGSIENPGSNQDADKLALGMRVLNRRVEQQRGHVNYLRSRLAGLQEDPRQSQLRALLAE